MKCVCDRSALQEALSAAASVTPTRTPKPILQCVRLSVEKEGLTLTAYDQEVGLRCRVREVEVSSPGEMLVPCDRMMAIIRESADETMALEVADDLLHIRGRDSHFQIVGQDVREFPPVPDMEGQADLVVKKGDLQAAAEKTLFAAARESTRYAINGVLWQKQGNMLRLVATDGRRLAMSHAPVEKSSVDEVRAIVPAKALGILTRLHADPDELLEVRITPNQIIMRCEQATISSVLVEGNFPKWEDVVPKDNDKALNLNTAEFLSAVKRAALLSSIESKGIAMRLGDGELCLSSRSAEQGEAEVHVKIDYSGAELYIGFNPEFLIDALKVCGEETTFELKDPARPGLIRSGKAFQCVVMPVNLS